MTNSQTGLLWYYQGETLRYRVIYAYLPETGTIFTIGVNSQPYTGPDRNEDKLLLLLQAVYASLKSAGEA